MADSFNKIFAWQLVVAALVGLIWGLLWELDANESGFFFDVPAGMVQGFFWAVVALVVFGLIAVAIWVIVRLIQGPTDGLGESMSADLDHVSGSSSVEGANNILDLLNASGIAWGIGWGMCVAFALGLAGGVVWFFEVDSFALRLVVVLLFGIGGALKTAYLFNVTDELAGALGEGYGWLEGPMSTIRATWESWGLPGFWGFAGAVAWGIGCLFVGVGLGTGGIGAAIGIAVIGLLGALIGGIAGVQLKATTKAA